MTKIRRLNKTELRRLIQEESSSKRLKKAPTLASLLFEEDLADIAEDVAAKPVTLIVLYGPPAAGKGAAKSAVGDFAGIDADQNYEDWLDAMSKEDASSFFAEEDELMVTAMTETLPPLVFKELAKRVASGEEFIDAVMDYYHVNESGKTQELIDILDQASFEKIMSDNQDDIESSAEEFANFPNTQAFFTQARGFSKPIEGAPEELNGVLGVTGPGDGTLGVRVMAAGKYMETVKSEIQSIGAKEVGDSTYASVYLMDQAGESSADIGRISDLGKLKEDPDFPSVTLIGVYIYQPKERTTIANLHRASTGGRRVAQDEVERIFTTAPTIEGGKITKNGPAIDAMESAGFDQIHVYTPPNPFEPKDAKEFSQQICQPLGPGTGALDIEGCDTDSGGGNTTSARSLKGMEKQAAKKAGVDDISGDDGLPEASDLSDEQMDKVVSALETQGFNLEATDLADYLQNIKPPGIRGGGKHGKVPWAKALFGKGTNPTEKITVKKESRVRRANRDDLILERWRLLAGLNE
jgi:hypothetical protein